MLYSFMFVTNIKEYSITKKFYKNASKYVMLIQLLNLVEFQAKPVKIHATQARAKPNKEL